ncbi:MAG TPA: carbohydrate ABC transporter permease [Bacilli bacterium]
MGLKKQGLFDVINYSLILFVCIVMIYPFVNVASVSFSSYHAYVQNPLMIWPHDISFRAYEEIMSRSLLWSSYLNTIIVTVTGVTVGIMMYILAGYSLSKRVLKGRRTIMVLVVFTMLFNGGLIPNFYLMRSLGLLDSLAALVLPALFSGFSLILMINFFQSLSEEIEESARMDGASDPVILFRIIVPLSKPIIATLCLFSAVGYWNNFFNAVIYIHSSSKWPLMLYLREVIVGASMIAANANSAEMGADQVVSETLKYATLMLVMIPILCVYPFLQKYFVKGIMLGSVKG